MTCASFVQERDHLSAVRRINTAYERGSSPTSLIMRLPLLAAVLIAGLVAAQSCATRADCQCPSGSRSCGTACIAGVCELDCAPRGGVCPVSVIVHLATMDLTSVAVNNLLEVWPVAILRVRVIHVRKWTCEYRIETGHAVLFSFDFPFLGLLLKGRRLGISAHSPCVLALFVGRAASLVCPMSRAACTSSHNATWSLSHVMCRAEGRRLCLIPTT